jgi:hypothetical protein
MSLSGFGSQSTTNVRSPLGLFLEGSVFSFPSSLTSVLIHPRLQLPKKPAVLDKRGFTRIVPEENGAT